MQIELNGSVIYYQKSGHGSRNLLLFHGYGQDHSVFDALVGSLSDRYTCFSFDLLFHGQTSWNKNDHPILKEELKSFIGIFCEKENVNEFDLFGFSIGARYALAIFEAFPLATKEIFLVAPDGIKSNIWYSIATYPWVTRKLFKSFIHRPEPFFFISRMAGNFRLVNKKVLKFAEHEMKSSKKRSTIYHTWVGTRKLRFDIRKLAKDLDKHQVKVNLVLGKNDPMISHAEVKILLSSLKNPNLILIPAGHHNLLSAISTNPEKVF
jgi:pimeloyl-ACP methyl ester carboxylesterase